MIRIACAVVMFGIAAPPATQQMTSWILVTAYKNHTLLEGDQLERCSAILEDSLRRITEIKQSEREQHLIAIDQLMMDRDCFDNYSRLGPGPFLTERDKRLTLMNSLPKARIVGNDLVVTIPTFQKGFVDSLDGAIMRELKRLPDNWQSRLDTAIIDLRWNVGGDLSSLDAVLELFSPAPGIKTRVMKIKKSALATGRTDHIVTKSRGVFADMKVAFLVNDRTMSVSEWLIAIRQDWDPDHTRVLGEVATGGKSIVQCREPVQPFSIKVTCAEWFVAGKSILWKGIEPDQRIAFDDCTSDLCLVQRVHQLQAEAKPRDN